MLYTLGDFMKWVKHCYSLSPVLTFVFFFVVGLVIFGFFRGVFLYGSKICDTIMLLVMGSSWFSEKPVDGKSEKGFEGQSSAENKKVDSVVGGDWVVVNKDNSEKSMDVIGLSNILKEAVKEAVKEAMKDLVVKETKKKKEKVVSGDTTVAPKKKSKKTLAKEMAGVTSELSSQEVVVPKKKKSSSSKGKELVPKEGDPEK
nr:M-ORF [Pseudocuneopsis sichuanensis]